MTYCRPYQAMKSHNTACGPEPVGAQNALNVHLCLCYGLGPLWLFLSTTEQTAWLPVRTRSCNPLPPTHLPPPFHLLIHDTRNISGTVQSLSKARSLNQPNCYILYFEM